MTVDMTLFNAQIIYAKYNLYTKYTCFNSLSLKKQILSCRFFLQTSEGQPMHILCIAVNSSFSAIKLS